MSDQTLCTHRLISDHGTAISKGSILSKDFDEYASGLVCRTFKERIKSFKEEFFTVRNDTNAKQAQRSVLDKFSELKIYTQKINDMQSTLSEPVRESAKVSRQLGHGSRGDSARGLREFVENHSFAMTVDGSPTQSALEYIKGE